jgi:hypothetical protein
VKVRNCFPDYAIIQELIHKVQEQDQEILRLRKYLADYSTKEVQIRNEKYVLEKRIAHMRSVSFSFYLLQNMCNFIL